MGKHSRKNNQGVNYQRGGTFAWFKGLKSSASMGRVNRDEREGDPTLSRQLLRQGLRREAWSHFVEAGHGPRQHNDEFGPMPHRLRRLIAGAKFKAMWRERLRQPRVVPSVDETFRGLPPSFTA